MQPSLIFCSILIFLVALTISRPTATVDMIQFMARTTVGRIKQIKDEHFQMAPEIDFGFFDTPIDGLTSVLVHLSKLQLRLQVPPAQHLQQVQVDLDTLLSTLEGLAISQGCLLSNTETTVHKAETSYPFTSNYLYLLELQRYLKKLCVNTDKLKWCKNTDMPETHIL